MNVVEEHLPNCLVALHIEIPVDHVAQERDKVVCEFQKHASIQGFRKGSVPRKLIESKFSKEIHEELRKRLLSDSVEKAVKSKGLDVISMMDFENVELESNRPLRYTVKVVTAPCFELPDYSQIELELASPKIEEKDFEKALENFRSRQATYEPVEGRGLEMGDYAVLSYSTYIEGKPAFEVVPTAPKNLFVRKNAWILLSDNEFLSGFSEALLGAQLGETRNFALEISSEFSMADLRGKKLDFEVLVEGINREVLPEWSDELASELAPGKTLEEFKMDVRKNLEREAQANFERDKRHGIINFFLSQIQVDLPQHLVETEMGAMLREMVRENQIHGFSDEDIQAQQDHMVGFARKSAKDRVMSTFLLLKIAEKENLKIGEKELINEILQMSSHYNILPEKLIKDIHRKKALGLLREQLLAKKTIDFLAQKVTVREPANESSSEPSSISS